MNNPLNNTPYEHAVQTLYHRAAYTLAAGAALVILALGTSSCSEMKAPVDPTCCPTCVDDCVKTEALDFCQDITFELGVNPERWNGKLRKVNFHDVSANHCGYVSGGYPNQQTGEIGPNVTEMQRMWEVDSAEGDSATVADFMRDHGGAVVLAKVSPRFGNDQYASTLRWKPNTVTRLKVYLNQTSHPNEGFNSLLQNGYLYMRALAYGDTVDLGHSREGTLEVGPSAHWVPAIVCNPTDALDEGAVLEDGSVRQ
jgi:hypothetical protein